MPMYTNIGGGSKQLTSLYINKDGSNKELSNAYANINGSSKEIFSKLYKWAKYAKGSHYMALQYNYRSWQVSLYTTYSICKSISVNSSETEDSSGRGRVYYGENTVSGAYYPGQTSDTVGYYLCAPYNTIDVSGDSAILEAKYAGAYGYYAYRISGFKMDGENRYTLLDREARANYNYNYDDFVEYVTSTNKNAYPSNGISGDYKYILQN